MESGWARVTPMPSPTTPSTPDGSGSDPHDPLRVDRRKLLLGGTAAAGLAWVAPVVLQTTGATASASPNSCPRCGTNVLPNASAEDPTGTSTAPSLWTTT